METRLLEYFATVAAEGSVTEAARQLYAAQSTVSAGLRSLERELGVELFERSTRRVALTCAGEELLPRARRVLDEIEEMRAYSAAAAGGLTGKLRIGIFAAMEFLNGLPQVVSSFSKEFPNVSVRLVASHTGSTGLCEDLHHGRLDLAFFALAGSDDIDAVEMGQSAYVALAPVGHRLAAEASVTLAQLCESPWVDVLPGYGNRVQIEGQLEQRGLERRVVAEVAELPSVPSYVAAGIGVAVVPDVVATDGCVVLPLADEIPPWTLSIAARKGSFRRPVIAEFVKRLQEHGLKSSTSAGESRVSVTEYQEGVAKNID